MRILKHHSDVFAQVFPGNLPDIHPVNGNLAGLDIVKAVEQVGNRRFSGSGGTDKSDFLSWLGVQADVLKNGFLRIVAKAYIFQADKTFHRL